MKLSYSSSNEIKGCQRRYFHRKVRETPVDPDHQESRALGIGNAFHQVLEDCSHQREKLTNAVFRKAFIDNNILSSTEEYMIEAMVLKYLDLHETSGLSVAICEMPLLTEEYKGFIDVIMVDDVGNWWVVDLKTTGRFMASIVARLSNDPQLNIYASFAEYIAKELKLNLHQFMGVRYRVTTKATIKVGKKETKEEYIQRCLDRIESYDIGVPAADLRPQEAYNDLMRVRETALEISETPEHKIPQNFQFCESFFKPCPYWSRCFGQTHTSSTTKYPLYSTETIINLKQQDALELL